MLKVIVLCWLQFYLQSSTGSHTEDLTVYVALKQSPSDNDALECATYSWFSIVRYWISSQYKYHFDVTATAHAKAAENDMLSKTIFCDVWIAKNGRFAALLEPDAIDSNQPKIGGVATILAHVQHIELFWTASVLCKLSKPRLFLEIKEYNLSFNFTNVPALFVRFVGNVTNMFCLTRKFF